MHLPSFKIAALLMLLAVRERAISFPLVTAAVVEEGGGENKS